ncbi:MAG: hypothetical protein HQM08_18590 [Candidatus Riflebacteria bacterium]|nr:hypothetical protein [Candidatus Riflebacteria bacterium]
MRFLLKNARKGMILLVVIGCLIFVSIIFASLINRVRHESSLTNRNSINEDLYQLALSIGRLTLKKLSREIENKNNDQKEINDAIFNGTSIKDKEYESIDYLDVITKLKERYPDLSSKVLLSVDFDPQGFQSTSAPSSPTGTSAGTAGPYTFPDLVQPPLERKGTITVKVTVTAKRNRKSCKLIKQFLVVRLLPGPYHKFTLYCSYGADLKQSDVNRLTQVADDGKISDNDPPLVLFNRPVDLSKQDFDFTNTAAFSLDPKMLVQSGWIYLGGDGQSKINSSNPDRFLILNVCSGEKTAGTIAQKYFGEAYHFFFDNSSNGWLGSQEWSQWIASAKPNLNGRMLMTFVDYGLYADMFTAKTSFNQRPIFSKALEIYKASSNPVFQGQVWDGGSALHLYGVPTALTPTLVFGQVKRRFMRTFAFYFADISKVYPIRWDMAGYWMGAVASQAFFDNELGPWLATKNSQMATQPLASDVNEVLNQVTFKNFGSNDTGSRSPIGPNFIQHESYMESLKNICSPGDPTKTLESILPNLTSNYPKDKIGKKDYQFGDDAQVQYKGRIDYLSNFPSNFLGPKVSYYIKESGSVAKIENPNTSNPSPQFKFLLDKKILVPDTNGTSLVMYLNQILRFDGDLEIDYPIHVQKGGIIIVDGKVTLNQPIHNLFLVDTSASDPDKFGLVTIIAKNGITINSKSFSDAMPNQVYPEVHAILICLNNGAGCIEVDGPVHIKGSVAIDRLDRPTGNNLLAKGGIIEWGFDPAEFAQGDPISQQCYYGFAMGPKDYEIVEED